ncbi:DUF6223 family protein [Streptomyces sp. NPDC020807]|uniref:DUF6223 family protein n=1 Tax=Streptomyces sp. NPDC020807 TaxID=3155119 RepID=UPI0033D80497
MTASAGRRAAVRTEILGTSRRPEEKEHLMSVRTALAVTGTAATVLVGALVLAVPAAADPAVPPVAANVYTFGVGRVTSAVAGVIGLLGAVNGGLVLAGRAGGGHVGAWVRRNGAVTALVAGLVALVGGAVVAATAEGAVGTGNGLGGAYVAMAVGAVAVALGALGQARSRSRSRA